MTFDRTNKEHKIICLAAMVAADQFGAGRIRACKEQLELNDIVAYRTIAEQDAFQRAVMDWGSEIK